MSNIAERGGNFGPSVEAVRARMEQAGNGSIVVESEAVGKGSEHDFGGTRSRNQGNVELTVGGTDDVCTFVGCSHGSGGVGTMCGGIGHHGRSGSDARGWQGVRCYTILSALLIIVHWPKGLVSYANGGVHGSTYRCGGHTGCGTVVDGDACKCHGWWASSRKAVESWSLFQCLASLEVHSVNFGAVAGSSDFTAYILLLFGVTVFNFKIPLFVSGYRYDANTPFLSAHGKKGTLSTAFFVLYVFCLWLYLPVWNFLLWSLPLLYLCNCTHMSGIRFVALIYWVYILPLVLCVAQFAIARNASMADVELNPGPQTWQLLCVVAATQVKADVMYLLLCCGIPLNQATTFLNSITSTNQIATYTKDFPCLVVTPGSSSKNLAKNFYAAYKGEYREEYLRSVVAENFLKLDMDRFTMLREWRTAYADVDSLFGWKYDGSRVIGDANVRAAMGTLHHQYDVSVIVALKGGELGVINDTCQALVNQLAVTSYLKTVRDVESTWSAKACAHVFHASYYGTFRDRYLGYIGNTNFSEPVYKLLDGSAKIDPIVRHVLRGVPYKDGVTADDEDIEYVSMPKRERDVPYDDDQTLGVEDDFDFVSGPKNI